MPLLISTPPNLRHQTQRIELDGVIYLLTLRWLDRPQGWYLDLFSQEGGAIAVGRRLNPSWNPLRGATNEKNPPGVFVVTGRDGYAREDLGDSLRLYYYRASEIEEPL